MPHGTDLSALFSQSAAFAVQKLRDTTHAGSAQALAPAVPHGNNCSALFSQSAACAVQKLRDATHEGLRT